jgi:hypothetical protein
MANANTIAGMAGCAASGNVIAETAFGIAPANTVRAFLTMPTMIGSSTLDGREFLLRLGIVVTTGASLTYTPSIRLYSGGNTALTTFTNDTAIITPGAITIATVTRLITINARLMWSIDPTAANSRLNGSYTMQADTAFTAWAALTAGLSAGAASAAALDFCVTGIFGTTNGANTAVLKYCELDLV